jgi:uncharacterized protein (DUF2249 family)
MPTAAVPASLVAAGVKTARELDVRPVLARGGDPFHLIMKTVQSLGPDEALHLVVGFEPVPLYGVLRAAGYAAETEREGEAYHVYFYRDPSTPPPAAVGAERVPLQPPVEMDVRDLEPPGPMLAILEKLTELGAGAQIHVRHHREPVLLYDKLALRGFAARAEKQPAGDYIVRIAPAWAFEEKRK